MISPQLLDVLACPVCGGDVEQRENALICRGCQREYEIKNNIPIMLTRHADTKNKQNHL